MEHTKEWKQVRKKTWFYWQRYLACSSPFDGIYLFLRISSLLYSRKSLGFTGYGANGGL